MDGGEYHPVFFDLDGCRDPETREIAPWAIEIVKALDTYAEVSPSGRGIRAVGLVREPEQERMLVFCTSDGKKFIPKRDLPEDDRDEYHSVEVYGGGVGNRHLISFTGRPLEGYDRPVTNVQEWINENVPKSYSGRGSSVLDFKDLSPEISGNLKDKVIRICESIKRKGRDDLFKKLYYQGDWSAFPSRSEAEISLLNILTWATEYLFKDMEEREAVMKRVFQDSEFFKIEDREQWSREGYLDDQIKKAINDCTSGYTGKPKEQILRKLEVFRIDVDWRFGGKKDNANARAAYGAHLALAYDHGWFARGGESVLSPDGRWCMIPEDGVLVHSSARDTSLFSGVKPTVTEKDGREERDYRNITKLNDFLEEKGFIIRIYRGVAWGTSSLYLLPKPVVDSYEFSSVFSLKTHKPEPQFPPHTPPYS